MNERRVQYCNNGIESDQVQTRGPAEGDFVAVQAAGLGHVLSVEVLGEGAGGDVSHVELAVCAHGVPA